MDQVVAVHDVPADTSLGVRAQRARYRQVDGEAGHLRRAQPGHPVGGGEQAGRQQAGGREARHGVRRLGRTE